MYWGMFNNELSRKKALICSICNFHHVNTPIMTYQISNMMSLEMERGICMHRELSWASKSLLWDTLLYLDPVKRCGLAWGHGWALPRTSFLSFSIADISCWQTLVSRGCSLCPRMFSRSLASAVWMPVVSPLLWQWKYLQTLLNVPCGQNCLQLRTTGLEEEKVSSVWRLCRCFDGLASIWGQKEGLLFTVSLINVCQICLCKANAFIFLSMDLCLFSGWCVIGRISAFCLLSTTVF